MRQNAILSLHVQSFIDYAVLKGMSADELMNSSGYAAGLHIADMMVPAEALYTVLGHIDDRLQDPLMGIRAAASMSLNALGLIYQISLKAVTVKEAVFYLVDYLRATLPMVDVDAAAVDDTVHVRLVVDNGQPPYDRYLLEALLAIIARELTLMAADCSYTCHSPFCDNTYPEGWQPGKHFALYGEHVDLRAAMRKFPKWHLETLVPEYLKFTGSLMVIGSFADSVKLTALKLACPALPALQAVATHMNITPRTLQRRLATEDMTFRDVCDMLNRHLSDLLLQHERFSILDISDILGYSEPAAFIRAFRRWHGKPPGRLRASG